MAYTCVRAPSARLFGTETELMVTFELVHMFVFLFMMIFVSTVISQVNNSNNNNNNDSLIPLHDDLRQHRRLAGMALYGYGPCMVMAPI